MITIQDQINKLKTLGKTSREYQVALAGIKTTASRLLSETSTKEHPEDDVVKQEILDAIEEVYNPLIDISTYFTEFDDVLDSIKYKVLIQNTVRDKLRTLCYSKGINIFYLKMLSRVTTLRKLRSALEVLQGILEMKDYIEYLRSDVKVQMVYPKHLLIENTKLRNEIDSLYSIYTQEDEEISLYYKYKKLKEDGLNLRDAAKVLGLSTMTLQRLTKGFTMEIQPSNCVGDMFEDSVPLFVPKGTQN